MKGKNKQKQRAKVWKSLNDKAFELTESYVSSHAKLYDKIKIKDPLHFLNYQWHGQNILGET